MKKIQKLFNYIKHPSKIREKFNYILTKSGFYNSWGDEKYIRKVYKFYMKKDINLDNPQTYNEKLNWLKIHDRNPEYIKMVDKYEAKKYAEGIIGKKYIIPTLGIWDKFDDIDFDKLPNEFVIKCTHDSGGLVIVKDKSKFNMKKAKKIINSYLKRNYYYFGREWPYKNIKPRIIVEKYMEDSKYHELRDYKFFCFNGEPKALFVATDRNIGETKFDFYDMDFKHLDIVQHYPNSDKKIDKPQHFDKMIELSKKLSKGLKHVRIDFYEVNGNIYFGEFTFYHFSGFQPFNDEKWDLEFGKWIDIKK